MSEARAATLLARLRAAYMAPVLDADGCLFRLPPGASLSEADARQVRRHAPTIRAILLRERDVAAVEKPSPPATCPPPVAVAPTLAAVAARLPAYGAATRLAAMLQDWPPDVAVQMVAGLAVLLAALDNPDPKVVLAARRGVAELATAIRARQD